MSGEFDNVEQELMQEALRSTQAAEAAALAAPPAESTVETTTETTPATPAPAEGGNPRAALRAARAAERKARDRADRLERENAELRAKVPNTESSAKPDQELLEDVKTHAPKVTAYIDELEAENERLRQAAPKDATATPDFEAEVLDKDIQDEVDQVPELAEWQASKDKQDLWRRAKAADALLSQHVDWADKPMAERFAEAVSQAKKAAGLDKAPTAKPTLSDEAKRVIEGAAKPAATPIAIGDLRGNSAPATSSIPDYYKMVRDGKTDEDIIASLPAS
jgi:hypothetical protein